MTQRLTQITALVYFETVGPPSSPPINTLLATRMMKHTTATIKNMKTENERPLDGTLYSLNPALGLAVPSSKSNGIAFL